MPCYRATLVLSLLCLACCAAVRGQSGPAFHAAFDGTATAHSADAASAVPTAARELTYVPGVQGKAVYLGGHGQGPYEKMPLLEYDAGSLFSGEGGTVMFWVQPNWDGYFTDPLKFPTYFLFCALGGRPAPDFATRDVAPTDGCDRIWLFMWNWLRADLFEKPGKPLATLAWQCRNTWMKGDWWHVALVWHRGGWSRLYVNGIPHAVQAQPALKDLQRFYVGSLPRAWTSDLRANAAFDELAIYRRALSDAEVRRQFRRVAPIDYTLERRFLRAGEPERLELEVAPGPGADLPVSGRLTVSVQADRDGREVARRDYPIQLRSRTTLTLPLGRLAEGAYRATCRWERGGLRFQRSFALTVYRQQPAPPATRQDLALGERIATVDCSGTGSGFVESASTQVKPGPGGVRYREAGAGRWDRFGFEVEVPGADGSPVALEVTWPDDRERAMSWYMMPASASMLHRDRLSGGVQCGGEYPTSGRMQTTRYLFYPTEGRYLFEARTLVPGLPAAVARVDLYRIKGRLPRLAIQLPASGPRRSFGHLDEDQSFEVLFGGPQDPGFRRSPLPYGYPIQAAERLLDYMDYTGQDVLSYAFMRYTYHYLDEAPVNGTGESMRIVGWERLLLDMMARRGKQMLAEVNIWSVPAQGASREGVQDRVGRGYFAMDRAGKAPSAEGDDPGFGDNPCHPEVRARLLGWLGEVLRRYGREPAFRGIDLWCGGRFPCLFGSLDMGYDDLTMSQFQRDTGIRVPGSGPPAARCAARHAYLVTTRRREWLAWRAHRNTELLAEIDRMVRRTRPDLRLHVSVLGWYDDSAQFLDAEQCEDFSFNRFSYEGLGLDLPALKRLPQVVLTPVSDGTYYRWLKHWFGGRETITGELNHNTGKFAVFANGVRSAASIYLRYFECFTPSLKQETYKAYFQNSDPKAHGRMFLQDLAVAVASQDASQILIGAQPIGTTGRDREAREFAAAYRALPAGNYRDVGAMGDPVAARYLPAADGCLLYTVNLSWSSLTATLDVGTGGRQVTDLSTGLALPLRGGRLQVALKPFELRALRVRGAHVRPRLLHVAVPAETARWFADQVARVAAGIADLRARGVATPLLGGRLAAIRADLAAGRLADAHRLLVSKLVREIPLTQAMAADGSLKQMADMAARSEYAVACGRSTFLRTPSGRLYFPDRAFAPGSYGFVGSHQSVARATPGFSGPDEAELYGFEAYNLDGYRFAVKPGRYTVRLHMKVGYEPGAKPGVFVFDADIEGRKALQAFDVFAACGDDFGRTVVKEFRGVEVRDGVLDIGFSLPPRLPVDPSARLCNAIEVIPER